ncbi:hypothetical protein BKA93DRAFT_825338 [Sparassis latifolia]
MSIGIQGTLHADGKDAHEFWTLFTLLFRLPPGADPGAFLLAQPGTYIRETGELTLFAAFKGNDLHGGSAPYAPPEEMRKWEAEILKEIGTRFGVVKRVGYVSYPSTVGVKQEFNDEESDSEEELSEILDFDEKNNQYHVHWLGYNTQQDSWVKTSDIHASEMIQAFWQARGQEGPPLPLSSNECTRRRHHEKNHESTSLGEDISMNSLETAIGEVSSSAHEFTVQRLPEYDIQQSNEQTSEQAQTIISRPTMQKLGNTSLTTLFNSASLHSELEQLHSTHSKLEHLPNDLQNPKQWLRGLAIQTQINEEIKLLPEGQWSAEGAMVIFKQLTETIKALPVLEAAQAFTDTLNRALRWEICRA